MNNKHNTHAQDMLESILGEISQEITEPILDCASKGHEINKGSVTAQILMAFIGESEIGESNFTMPKELRKKLLDFADHCGPDWAQAFYHAIVFVTRNA